MAKKKEKNASVPERLAALAKRVEDAAAQLQLASQALQIAQPHENLVAYLENSFSRLRRDIKDFRGHAVLNANLWPGANEHYTPHRTDDELEQRITSELLTPRPTSPEDHANKIFCRVFHATLPKRFSKEWDAWKGNASEELGKCAGARDALQERVKLAKGYAQRLQNERRITAEVTRFGDLRIPREFDPWPNIRIGDLDENRMEIVARTIWGYEPDDRPVKDYWVFDDEEFHEIYETGPDDEGNNVQYDSEYYCGLMLCLKRVYKAPHVGESIALDQVPVSHWYREGRTIKQRDGKEPNSHLDRLVVYAGEQPVMEQLELL